MVSISSVLVSTVLISIIIDIRFLVPTGILLEVYSPLGNPGRPGKTDTDPVVLEDPVVKEIATKLNCTAAQVQ